MDRYVWFDKIRVGQRLYFKTFVEAYDEFDGKVPCGYPEYMANDLEGESIVVTKELKKLFANKETTVKTILSPVKGWQISPAMLKVSNKAYNVYANEAAAIKTTEVEIEKISEKDKAIVDEMISKVNLDIVRGLLKITSHQKEKDIPESIVNTYMRKWAKAKMPIYLKMGRKFTADKEVDIPMSTGEMLAMKKDLAKKFPAFGSTIMSFCDSDYINNLITYVPRVFSDCDIECVKGTKLTKFMSKLIKNDVFDVELSKITQNRVFKGSVVLSIDPVDFLTMSLTKHGWASCYNIYDGCYHTASLSLMIDDVTVIGYRHNNKIYDYDIGGFKYRWNSKQSRNVVSIDFEKNVVIMASAQGSPNSAFYQTEKEICESLIGSELKSFCWNRDKRSNYHHHIYDDISDMTYAVEIKDKAAYSSYIGAAKVPNLISGVESCYKPCWH